MRSARCSPTAPTRLSGSGRAVCWPNTRRSDSAMAPLLLIARLGGSTCFELVIALVR